MRKAAGDEQRRNRPSWCKLAAEKRLVNAVNFNIRFYPMAQQARAMVQSGELGDLFIIQGSYLQDWLLLPTDWNWRLEPGLGGTLRAVARHRLALAGPDHLHHRDAA